MPSSGGALVGTEVIREAETVEEYVMEYFEDIPIMTEVARCESQFVHYTDSGNILRGRVNKSDIGVMQINEYYHGDTAKRLDIDLYTLEGNVEYARDLYERKGTQPWDASKPCWGSQKIAKK